MQGNEIEQIINLERGQEDSLFQEDQELPLSHAVIGEDDTRNLEQEQQRNQQYRDIYNRLQDPNSRFIAFIPVYDDGHWLLCIVNKQADNKQYLFAHTASNMLIVDHPQILSLLSHLERSIISTTNIKEDENEEEEIVPAEAFADTDSLPSLGLLFNGEAPRSIQLFIESVKNARRFHASGKSVMQPLLFSGPPGVGKNMIAQHIARQTDCDIVYKNGGQFITKWQGSGIANLRRTFSKAAQSFKPVIVFIDEIDGIGRQATTQTSEESQRGVEILQGLLNQYRGSEKVFLMGATNFPELMPEALKSRFSEIKINLLDFRARRKMIFFHLTHKRLYLTANPDFIKNLVYATRNWSGRDIEHMINLTKTSLFLNIPTPKVQGYTFYFNEYNPNPKAIWDRISIADMKEWPQDVYNEKMFIAKLSFGIAKSLWTKEKNISLACLAH